VVLITHFMEEAANAERIVIMNRGKVVLDGPPKEVFAKRDDLRAMSLDVPFAVELSHRLRAKGIQIPMDVVDKTELVKTLCQLK
jgi:energy-coupling factor transport system ATP-binding protein